MPGALDWDTVQAHPGQPIQPTFPIPREFTGGGGNPISQVHLERKWTEIVVYSRSFHKIAYHSLVKQKPLPHRHSGFGSKLGPN